MRRTRALIVVGLTVAVIAVIAAAITTTRDGEETASAAVSRQAAGVSGEGAAGPSPGAIDDAGGRCGDDRGDVAGLLELGDAHFRAQRLDAAEHAYAEALDLEPGSAAAQTGMAMVWYAQGDPERAEKALHVVIDTHPDEQDAHYALAELRGPARGHPVRRAASLRLTATTHSTRAPSTSRMCASAKRFAASAS